MTNVCSNTNSMTRAANFCMYSIRNCQLNDHIQTRCGIIYLFIYYTDKLVKPFRHPSTGVLKATESEGAQSRQASTTVIATDASTLLLVPRTPRVQPDESISFLSKYTTHTCLLAPVQNARIDITDVICGSAHSLIPQTLGARWWSQFVGAEIGARCSRNAPAHSPAPSHKFSFKKSC